MLYLNAIFGADPAAVRIEDLDMALAERAHSGASRSPAFALRMRRALIGTSAVFLGLLLLAALYLFVAALYQHGLNGTALLSELYAAALPFCL